MLGFKILKKRGDPFFSALSFGDSTNLNTLFFASVSKNQEGLIPVKTVLKAEVAARGLKRAKQFFCHGKGKEIMK